jgi:hypothetical protein
MIPVLGCLLACALALGGDAPLIPVQATPGGQPAAPRVWGPVPGVVADRVVFRVNQANAYCAWLGDNWVADCLADQYDQIARGLPRTDDWNPVRRVMAEAAARMNQTARSNPAAGVRPARPDEAGRPTQASAGRALQRTSSRAVPLAARIVAETETLLLRSVAGTDQRAAAFRRVAAAVGSGVILLRST